MENICGRGSGVCVFLVGYALAMAMLEYHSIHVWDRGVSGHVSRQCFKEDGIQPIATSTYEIWSPVFIELTVRNTFPISPK